MRFFPVLVVAGSVAAGYAAGWFQRDQLDREQIESDAAAMLAYSCAATAYAAPFQQLAPTCSRATANCATCHEINSPPAR